MAWQLRPPVINISENSPNFTRSAFLGTSESSRGYQPPLVRCIKSNTDIEAKNMNLPSLGINDHLNFHEHRPFVNYLLWNGNNPQFIFSTGQGPRSGPYTGISVPVQDPSSNLLDSSPGSLYLPANTLLHEFITGSNGCFSYRGWIPPILYHDHQCESLKLPSGNIWFAIAINATTKYRGL